MEIGGRDDGAQRPCVLKSLRPCPGSACELAREADKTCRLLIPGVNGAVRFSGNELLVEKVWGILIGLTGVDAADTLATALLQRFAD